MQQMIPVVLAVAGLGLLIGLAIRSGVQRGAQDGQRAQRLRTAQYCSLIVVAVLLIYDAIDTPRHRYFNIAVVAIMAAGVAFDWVRARRTRKRA